MGGIAMLMSGVTNTRMSNQKSDEENTTS